MPSGVEQVHASGCAIGQDKPSVGAPGQSRDSDNRVVWRFCKRNRGHSFEEGVELEGARCVLGVIAREDRRDGYDERLTHSKISWSARAAEARMATNRG